MFLGDGNLSALTSVRTWRKMFREGTCLVCVCACVYLFIYVYIPINVSSFPCNCNPADGKKWARLLALPLQLSCVFCGLFFLGVGLCLVFFFFFFL